MSRLAHGSDLVATLSEVLGLAGGHGRGRGEGQPLSLTVGMIDDPLRHHLERVAILKGDLLGTLDRSAVQVEESGEIRHVAVASEVEHGEQLRFVGLLSPAGQGAVAQVGLLSHPTSMGFGIALAHVSKASLKFLDSGARIVGHGFPFVTRIL